MNRKGEDKPNSTIIFRPSMLYGKGFHEGYFTIMRQLEKGKYKIIGDGSNHIPVLHAEDAAKAYGLAVKQFGHKSMNGLKTMNVSCDPAPTQRELIWMLCDILGAPVPKDTIPVWNAKTMAKLGEFYYGLRGKPKPLVEFVNKMASDRVFDVSLAKETLGYRPEKALHEGIKEVVEEYKNIREDNKTSK